MDVASYRRKLESSANLRIESHLCVQDSVQFCGPGPGGYFAYRPVGG